MLMDLQRKPGIMRAGDIVRLKGSTKRRKVHSVYWTKNGDMVMLYTKASPLGPFPAEKFELVLNREQRICETCDLPVFGPEHLASSCQVR